MTQWFSRFKVNIGWKKGIPSTHRIREMFVVVTVATAITRWVKTINYQYVTHLFPIDHGANAPQLPCGAQCLNTWILIKFPAANKWYHKKRYVVFSSCANGSMWIWCQLSPPSRPASLERMPDRMPDHTHIYIYISMRKIIQPENVRTCAR